MKKEKQTNESILDEINRLSAIIEEETEKLNILRAKRRKLSQILKNRNYYDNNIHKEPQSEVYKIFGKKTKELTAEELREYNNLRAKRCREKARQ